MADGISGRLKKPTRLWKVKGLESAAVSSESGQGFSKVIYMAPDKFKKISQCIGTKNYRSKGKVGSESIYEHRRYGGLMVYIDSSNKTIRAEANAENTLNIVADELELPRYNSG
ncbi:MAG: hypothetical protein ACP5OG_05245 [Candidatus Nanoarchaeia archaeon]